MKYLLSMVLIALLFSVSMKAQEKMDQAEMMKKWQEYMTPGETHKMMAESVGDWTFKMKMWEDPKGEPQLYEGTTTMEMMLGGRYLHSINKGNMMNMPYEGHLYEGYDNASKEFTSVWIDNFGTGVMISKGKVDPKTHTLIMTGSSMDPMSGKEMAFKEIFKMVDKNNQTMEMYMIEGDKEIKTMEITYTRK